MNKNEKMLRDETIGKLLFKMSFPAIIGVLVMSLYNLVDSIFIGRGVGTLGLAGVAVVFPIQMIALAITQGIGIGSSSIISRTLGAKNKERAGHALGNFFTLSIGLGLIITILGLIFMDPLLKAFGSSDAILLYARDYMGVVFLSIAPFAFAAGGNNIIRAVGDAKTAMSVMIGSAIINLILDPIFIFTLDMGMKGAAWATVIAQSISAVYVLYYFISGKSGISLNLPSLKLKWSIVKETFAIGASSFVRFISGSIMVLVLNNSLAFYGGDLAIAVFGVINRLFMVFFMPIIGIVMGLQPIVGFNYGAKSIERVKSSIKLATKAATVISIVGFLILTFFSTQLIMLFSKDPELIAMGSYVTRIVVLMFPLVGIQMVASGVYQSMGKAVPALVLSLLRQVIFLIPIVLILPLFLKLDGIWLSFPLSDFLSSVVAGIMLYKTIKSLT